MSFEPPRERTRLPSPLGLLASIVVMAAIVGGAYIALFHPFAARLAHRLTGGESLPSTDDLADPANQEGFSRPARITVPAIGVDGPVLEMRLGNDGHWDAESIIGEVGHLEGTPYPGQAGNSVLAAHVTVPEGAFGPFKDLESMEPGQVISVWAHNGTLYTFEVVEKKMVPASAIDVIAPTPEPTLTLITCAGWDDDLRTYLERIVVVARLADVTPPT